VIRVGLGYDVHPFSADPDRALRLGGVHIDASPGLAGHSDADVIAHAVADAVLGAAGQPDLGALFPASDDRWAGADSLVLLAEATALVRRAGWSVVNVDCVVALEAPRLAPHRPAMERALSEVVGGPVSVKAKRGEGVGAIGRSEAVACWAVALLEAEDGASPQARAGTA
jgi:2-C-methyl-D-erythritol 2,4-cyclodiphosphate synthase